MQVALKKGSKSPQSVRYLLSADRRLQRISLRRISERVKRARTQKPRVRSNRPRHSASLSKSMRFPWTISSRAILFGLIGVVAMAALITARQLPPGRDDLAILDATRVMDAQPAPETVSTPPRAEMKKVVPEASPAAAPAATSMPDVSVKRAQSVEPVKTPALQPIVNTPAAAETAAPLASRELTSTARNVAPLTTITGCLELDKQTFRLKDTSGGDAPRSRSWRSGFLKKRSLPIEIVGATDALGLPSHVGQRVAATGVLTNRELQVHSLQQMAASCN